MPRPREHDETTREQLIDAAEVLIADRGPDGVSVRGVAEHAGTTTWAVYSLFGSRDGLLSAVAQRAIAVLDAGLRNFPESEDPAADLVGLGSSMYRTFVIEHPWPFRLAFQRVIPDLALTPGFFEARARTWGLLEHKLQRLDDAGGLGPRTVREAAVQFNALCEGLANAELRGGTLAPGDQQPIWRGAFEALVRGFALDGRAARRRRPARRSAKA